MHTTITGNRLHRILGRTAAITFLAAAGTLGLHAQQSAGTASPLPPVNLKASLVAPLNLSTPDDLGYSSSTGTAETASAVDFNLSSDANQPPPRRRYSRPNYSDSHTNPDGSSKYTFVVGGGLTIPTGPTHGVFDTGWRIQAGAGRNFNKTLGVIAQFDYDHFGINTSTLNNQLAIYNSLCTPEDQAENVCTLIPQLGGSGHDWSFTLNPIVNYYTSDTKGAYVIGGAGFYHKVTNFTVPTVGTYCDFFCYQYQANQTIDDYTSNAFGVNGGLGFTYKLSRFASTKLFVEGRYVYTFNSKRTFSLGDANGNGFNVFPQNSQRTSYIPITFGLRF